MPLGKLIKIVRTTNIYKKKRGRFYGPEMEEINVDVISLDTLKSIVTPNADDPLLYDGYPLSPDELAKLNELIEPKIKIDYKKYEYVLECYGIYEKESSMD